MARWLAAGAILLAGAASADIVHLDDGSTLEGIVKHNGDGYDVIQRDGRVVHVLAAHVRELEPTAVAGQSADDAMTRLESLRRSVENIGDLKIIIDRFEHFADVHKDDAAGKAARGDLAAWKDRLDKGMVKIGTRWVTPQERLELQVKAFEITDRARRMLKEGRMQEAQPLLQDALASDPGNVSALYLRGIIQVSQSQLAAARQSFEAVTRALPGCAPALNNTAVVLWRQKQFLAALRVYDDAMTAAPQTQEILDNVAETLNALPAEQKDNAVAQKAQRHFAEQDAVLQQQMAREGWHRWGATWVTKEQQDQVQAAQKENQKKIDDLSRQYDQAQQEIDQINNDVDENQRVMNRLEADSLHYDTRGNLIRFPLPSSYYDLDNDNHRLAARRTELEDKKDMLRTAAKEVQQHLPTPAYTGLQQLIGVEGTPLQPPERAAATEPSAPAGR